MTETLTAAAVRTETVRLESGCGLPGCAELAWRFQQQLGVPKYLQGAAILTMPTSLEQWRTEHRTARKRADKAARLGYRFGPVDNSQHSDDIHTINTSLPQRQGRPMTDGYTQPRRHRALPHYPCDRHRIHTYGVLQDSHLRAYLTLYRCGQLALVSMILGHADHLDNGIMYALFQGVVAEHAGEDATFFYNRWDSGQDGLRFYKTRLGFEPADLEFVL